MGIYHCVYKCDFFFFFWEMLSPFGGIGKMKLKWEQISGEFLRLAALNNFLLPIYPPDRCYQCFLVGHEQQDPGWTGKKFWLLWLIQPHNPVSTRLCFLHCGKLAEKGKVETCPNWQIWIWTWLPLSSSSLVLELCAGGRRGNGYTG